MSNLRHLQFRYMGCFL